MANIHPTAVVDKDAQIHADVEIGPYCVVGSAVTIKSGTKLYNNVTVIGETLIGVKNVIYPFACIGSDPQDVKYKKEKTRLEIGDNNIIREYVTINRGTIHGGGKTIIGNSNYFMACSHVAHDCIIGNNVIIANCALLAGHVKIEDNVYLSGQVCVHQFVTIGSYAFVSGDTRVPRDAPPYMITQGPEPEVVCVNTVGLKRHGFSIKAINALKSTHRIIWGSQLPLSEALQIVRNMDHHVKEVEYLLDFLVKSTKGKNGRAREALRSREPE